MKFLLLALLPLAFARDIPQVSFPEDLVSNPFVIGGAEVNPVGKYPWQGSLQYLGSHTCGCVLISGTLVLTAAHCTDGRDNPASFTVILGAHDRTADNPGSPESYSVSTIINHDDYNNGDATFAHDIGILVLSEPANEGNEFIGGIDFARSGDFAGDTCDYSGWGRTGSAGTLPLLLQEAQTVVMTTQECQNAVAGIGNVHDGHVCIFTGDNGACNGDSGGPLVCDQGGNSILVGITSWVISSAGNCNIAFPSAYCRVSEYADWIDANAP